MESFSDPQLLWLFLVAIPVGMFAVLVGASQFISLPLFQLFFPWMTLGQVVGNMKVGSVLRNLVSIYPLRKNINVQETLVLLIPLSIGSIIGALGVAKISQTFLLPAILIAVFLTEYGPKLSRYLYGKWFTLAALLIGAFSGILGAGSSVMIIGLLRVKITEEHRILDVRSQMLWLESMTIASSLLAYFFQNQLILPIWLTWAAGAMIGGFIGGYLVKYTGKFPPRIQLNLIRLIYLVAIAVAVYRLFA